MAIRRQIILLSGSEKQTLQSIYRWSWKMIDPHFRDTKTVSVITGQQRVSCFFPVPGQISLWNIHPKKQKSQSDISLVSKLKLSKSVIAGDIRNATYRSGSLHFFQAENRFSIRIQTNWHTLRMRDYHMAVVTHCHIFGYPSPETWKKTKQRVRKER